PEKDEVWEGPRKHGTPSTPTSGRMKLLPWSEEIILTHGCAMLSRPTLGLTLLRGSGGAAKACPPPEGVSLSFFLHRTSRTTGGRSRGRAEPSVCHTSRGRLPATAEP